MEAKLREIIAALLRAAPDWEGGSGRKSKTNIFPSFLTSVKEGVFDANDEKDYLMVFKCQFLSFLLNLDEAVT